MGEDDGDGDGLRVGIFEGASDDSLIAGTDTDKAMVGFDDFDDGFVEGLMLGTSVGGCVGSSMMSSGTNGNSSPSFSSSSVETGWPSNAPFDCVLISF